MPYINYSPTGAFAKAMFNFDESGYADYKFSGTVRVSVSDGFSNLDYFLGLLNDINLTMTPLSNEIPWPATTINNIQNTLTVISSFANITFSTVADYDTIGLYSICSPADVGLYSDINICYMVSNSNSLLGQSGLNTDYMGYTGSRGDIFINVDGATFVDGITFADYTKSRQTLMHELGHSLGLSHSFYPGTNTPTLDFSQLQYAGFDKFGFKSSSGRDINKEYFTIMSYDDQSGTAGLNAYTPMIFDVIALQAVYGEGAGTTGSGNDTIEAGTVGYRTYFDKGGIDTVDLNLHQRGSYLHMGTAISGAPHLVGVLMSINDAYTTVINGGNPASLRWFYGEYENASGSAYGDVIIGNDLDNIINGGAGNDNLFGGLGNDRFDWDPSLRGGDDTFTGGLGDDFYVVDSTGDSIQENAYEGVDTVITGLSYSISNTALENIKTFSDQVFAVSFFGNDWSNILEGGAGNDSLFGYEGSDTLTGGAGNDLIYGGNGSDTAKFTGALSDYSITQDPSGWVVVVDKSGSRDGTDKLSSVEFLSFSDGVIGTSDTSAPTVTNFSPSDEATGVAIGANIVVTFNEAIQRGTGNIVLKTVAGAVVATYDAATSGNLSISGSTLTINPTADLSYSTGCKVEFAAGSIKDIAGNNYAGVSDYNFTTGAAPDTTPPTVLTYTPADAATGVAAGSNIVLTFSEAIAKGTGAIEIRQGSATGTLIEAFDAATSSRLTTSGSTLTIDPTSDLASSTQYFVTFAAGSIKDVAGNGFAGTTAYDFTTADTVAPTVTNFSPSDEATGVAIGANVVVTFNEAIQRGTGSIVLKTSTGSVVATYDAATSSNLSISGSTLTINPTADLGYSTGYKVEFAAGSIKDIAGNNYAGMGDYNFTTGAAPDTMAPTVTITDNLSGTANRTTANVAYSLAFSESVTGLDPTDFTVLNGTIGSVSGSGSNWVVNVTPATGVANSTIALTLKAGAVSDLAGNVNATATNTSQVVDTVAPVAPKLETDSSFKFSIDPQITLQTTLGDVVLELYPEQSPITVANMLAYANAGFYDGTLFHRVIPSFMVQGGGLNPGLAYKQPIYDALPLESNNGLSNVRGTIAMARTNVPNSATTQFFVNQVDNTFLNYSSTASPGYAVFGRVVSGLAVIDSIVQVPTGTVGAYSNVPVANVTITSLKQTTAGSGITNTGRVTVSSLESGAQWSYSLDGGSTWTLGNGSSLALPEGSYAANAIQVRQTDAAGNLSISTGRLTSAMVVDSTPPRVSSFNPVDEATGVAIGANIVVTLNEAIQLGTGNIVLKTSAGLVVATYDAANSANLGISGSTLTINPTADLSYSTGYKVEFAAGSIKDIAGNNYAGVSDYNFTTGAAADTTPPTIALSSSQSSLSVGQTATINFVISESVSDFVAGDVTFSGGTLSNFSGSGTNYAATFTPTANSKVQGIVSVASNKFSDAAGNFNIDGSDVNNAVTFAVNTVIATNAKPTSASAALTTLEDKPLVFNKANFAFKDSNSTDSLQAVSITALPTKGALNLNGASVTVNQNIPVADIVAGKLAFTPVANANGKAYARVGFKVNDGKDFSTSTYYLTVNVDAVNDPPVVAKAVITPLSVTEGRAFSYSLLSGTFSDVERDVLTYSAIGLPTGISVDPRTGRLSGTPGYDSADIAPRVITIKATDKGGLSASMPLTMNVTNTPKILGTSAANDIAAGMGNDSVSGGAGDDTLSGGVGNDTLVGGPGNDVLTGGDGVDRFVYDSSSGSSDIDTIKDFLTGTDKIVLSAKVFGKFTGSSTGGAVTAGNLVVGAGATTVANDANDYLIYDTTSDLLYYDADGNGSGAAVAFVKVELTGTAAPAFGDFLVVS